MGLYKISLYDRGWLEWSSIANSTIQTGANGAYKSTTVVNELLLKNNLTTTQTTTVKINEIPTFSNSEKPIVTETTKQQQISIQTTKPMKPSLRPTTNSTDLINKNQFDLVSKNSAAGFLDYFNFNNKILIFIVSIFVSF
jgi:hypothetical protein